MSVKIMVEIKKVTTKKEIKQFVRFPIDLYKGNEYYVPCFYGDEIKAVSHKSSYENSCVSEFFLAYRDKKVVGRIQAIIQKQFNEIYNEKRVRFTRFDSIEDEEVSKALFDAVEGWAKEQGMDTICGPLGYSDFEREGLLIEGFDQEQTFEEQYNFDYYQRLIESLGYSKEVDWVESRIVLPKEVDPRVEKIAQHVLDKNKLHLIDTSHISKKEFLKRYADGFFDVCEDAYGDLYGYVPFTPETRRMVEKSFFPIIDIKEAFFLADENEKIIAIALTFPGVANAVKKSNGHLTIPAALRILHTIKNPKRIDLALIGVRKEFRNLGLSSVFVSVIVKEFAKYKNLKYLETNLNLEDNLEIRNMWSRFDSHENKRRRSYIKKL